MKPETKKKKKKENEFKDLSTSSANQRSLS